MCQCVRFDRSDFSEWVQKNSPQGEPILGGSKRDRPWPHPSTPWLDQVVYYTHVDFVSQKLIKVSSTHTQSRHDIIPKKFKLYIHKVK